MTTTTLKIGSAFRFTSDYARDFAGKHWARLGGRALRPDARGVCIIRDAGELSAVRSIEAIRPGTIAF